MIVRKGKVETGNSGSLPQPTRPSPGRVWARAAGGWLVVTDWRDDYLACKVCDWVLRLVDPAHFRMYGMKQCQALLAEAGFHLDRAQRFKVDWLWGLLTHRARA